MSKTVWKSAAAWPLILLLAACQPKASEEASEAGMMDQKVQVDLVAAPPGGNTAPDAGIVVPQLAYDYSYTLVAKADGVETLVKHHQTVCDLAGPAACQLISTRSSNGKDSSQVFKDLELRVSPAWLKTWQASLESDVKKAGGRISEHSVESEDLSLQIVDTEARLKNKEALRDRLAEIVRSRPGKISELVEAETQLAQTQADIDAARSALLVMRKRVATVHLTIRYQSEALAASRGTFAPLGDAVTGIIGNIVWALAGLITVLSFLLPLGLFGWGVFWLVRKLWKGRKKKAPVVPAPDSDLTS
ncbi:hypothetical protein ABI_39080 [Asticcacaulis biprosthecium C19]|uniref:DUF4349 domain-containing protein n=1 Tax=Asticcacaulis biprosthecium C19 TaxID=715226 RepID=F4QRX4_9CAUL|nr:DUF4349 domain-containing protein [Asticcacaulis biprosthecium]EGF89494.1 hypothetical protein ABI_39080 [Asticcacaulis biprosthecium C19]